MSIDWSSGLDDQHFPSLLSIGSELDLSGFRDSFLLPPFDSQANPSTCANKQNPKPPISRSPSPDSKTASKSRKRLKRNDEFPEKRVKKEPVKKEKDEAEEEVNEDENESSDMKRRQRLMRNRASAQLSRERKKAYMNSLVEENARLRSQVEALMTENKKLRSNAVNSSYPFLTLPVLNETPLMASPASEHSGSDDLSEVTKSRSSSPLNKGRIFFAFAFAFVLLLNFSGTPLLPPTSTLSHPSGRALLSTSQLSQPHPSFFSSPDVIESAPKGKSAEMALAQRLNTMSKPMTPSSSESFDSTYVNQATSVSNGVTKFTIPESELTNDLELLIMLYRKLLTVQALNSPWGYNASYFFVPSVFPLLAKSTLVSGKPAWNFDRKAQHRLLGSPESSDSTTHEPDDNSTRNSSFNSSFLDYVAQGDVIFFWMPMTDVSWSSFIIIIFFI
jgi:hypothetical protein